MKKKDAVNTLISTETQPFDDVTMLNFKFIVKVGKIIKFNSDGDFEKEENIIIINNKCSGNINMDPSAGVLNEFTGITNIKDDTSPAKKSFLNARFER